MIVSLIAGLAIAQPPSVADYFPLKPGTAWEYQEQGGVALNVYKDKVGPAEEVDGKQAYPVISTMAGKEVGRIYYRIEGDTVLLVAYEAKKPLPSPQPVLKVGPGRSKWEFTGQSVFINEPIMLEMKGESILKGKRQALGTEHEVVEVKLSGKLGGEGAAMIKVNQVAYYAKGIGLIEMLSENSVGSQKSKSQLKLLRFEAAP